MLFTKKKCFSITEKQIKKDILSKDGDLLLKINLRYPQLNCPKNDPLRLNAMTFYQRFAEALEYYGENDLKCESEKLKLQEDFSPFSLWMRWESPFLDDRYLSIMLEIAITRGNSPTKYERKTQVWERKFGTKCKITEFADKAFQKEIKESLSDENKKNFDPHLFLLTEDSLNFYIPTSNGFSSVSVPMNRAILQR